MSAEEFDEKKFCRYYLKLYIRLKELDQAKQIGVKFSKAFSEFTSLVYHNVIGVAPGKASPFGDETKKAAQKQMSVAR